MSWNYSNKGLKQIISDNLYLNYPHNKIRCCPVIIGSILHIENNRIKFLPSLDKIAVLQIIKLKIFRIM